MKSIISFLVGPGLDKDGQPIDENPADFDAAIAAIDRAAAERTQIEEPRQPSENRREDVPDPRPPGSPERRSGFDRRASATPGFGKRGIKN